MTEELKKAIVTKEQASQAFGDDRMTAHDKEVLERLGFRKTMGNHALFDGLDSYHKWYGKYGYVIVYIDCGVTQSTYCKKSFADLAELRREGVVK